MSSKEIHVCHKYYNEKNMQYNLVTYLRLSKMVYDRILETKIIII